MSRPLCSTCFREAREEGSNRCAGCGPGRIKHTNVNIDATRDEITLADIIKKENDE